MPSCVVKSCKNYTKKCSKKHGISYHRFPSNPVRQEAWSRVLRLQRDDLYFKPTRNTRVCSAHFLDEDFVTTKAGLRRLKHTVVVPRISPPQNVHQAAHNDRSQNPGFTERQTESQDIELMDVDISDLQSIFDTPRKAHLKKKIKRLKIRHRVVAKKIKNLQKQNVRLKKKNKSLVDITKELKQKKYITSEIEATLGINAEIAEIYRLQMLKNRLHKIKTTKKRPSYPPILRKFAMTLNFYSPSAYKFVRRSFDCCLPHPTTLTKWYSSIDAEPGFTKEAFEILKAKRGNMSENIECALIFDEMNIRQSKLWRGERNVGHVDMGNGNIDKEKKATKVFILMLVCLSENWKIPLGYFLVDGFTSEQIANTINICLEKCHSVGVNVEALTFDGCPANVKAVNILGCNISNTGQLKTTFLHPITKDNVVVFLDACHMIKLVRNVFENKKVIFNGQGQRIEWKFLTRLLKLQTNKKLNFANKITPRHIFFKNQIMKVKLASQLLSRSVAIALKLCDEVLHSSHFYNSSPTVEFITMFNDVFDILNSRRFNQSEFKRSISYKNKSKIFEFIEKAIDYIKGLQVFSKVKRTIKKRNREPKIILTITKKRILDSKSKTGFLGMIVCLESLKILYHKLIETDSKLQYISTYRLSQDHLELFFSLIRKHGGYNDNPNAIQFKGAYRKVLNHLSLKSSFTGNCIPLDNFSILTVSSVKTINSTAGVISHEEEDEFCETDQTEDDIMYANNCNHLSRTLDNSSTENVFQHLTEDIELIVGYIAGWVARSLSKQLKCEICINSMLSDEKLTFHKLIELKNIGGLCFPSSDMFVVCVETEKNIRRVKRPHFMQKSDSKYLSTKTLQNFVGKSTFSVLDLHSLDQPATFNHRLHLIRAIIKKYITVRMHHESNMENMERITNRQKLKKIVLFKGQ